MHLLCLLGVLFLEAFRPVACESQCPADGALKTVAPKVNIWTPLSRSDTQHVQEWLYGQQALNLTRTENAALSSDNTLWLIESIMPNKTDALIYLDGHGKEPPRYARAVLYCGGLKIPRVQEYMVGPLPISAKTTYSPLSYVYQNSTAGINASGAFPFNARYTASVESAKIDDFIISFMEPLAAITEDLIGGSYTGSGTDKIAYSWQGPNSLDGGWRRYWVFFVAAGNGAIYLGPTGFFVNIDTSGTDSSQWSVRRIVYNNQVFNSIDKFTTAYKSGSLKRGVKPDLINQDWSTRKRTGNARALDKRPTPHNVVFGGSRIKADKNAQYVEWMGWSLYLGFNRDTGLTLWNIKFKGERIIYELALQEAIAQYGGNDPVQSSTAYLDRHYGIGEDSRPLLSGYDCPYGALTMNASYHEEDKYHSSLGAICIFEADPGFPTSRHADTTRYGWYGSTRGAALTVRTMANVYNYDYLFDHIFYLEGSIEVRMAASGYLQATYWDARQNDYGTRVHETTMGSVHSHVINYKVDLDVAGTANSLQTNEVVVEQVTKPWFDPEDGLTRQLRIKRSWIDKELQTNLGGNGQKSYLIANKNSTNRWGYPRAYRFQPGLHAIHNPVKGARILLNNARWGEWDLMVAKLKDTGPSSSTTWNQNLPVTPPVDFSKFFNPPESIDQEDLVIYANLGMHHIPRAEDIPNTLFTNTRSSFILSPFNYFDEEPSRDIRNAILLQADENDVYRVQDSGTKEETCTPPAFPKVQYTGQTVLGA
ncbi:Primary-amine oxidase [Ceratobasidium theobromae]|uniref:Amine oxidase n=1 Tax=Ceratobasidium theobromae TaxID=1582974 RepID=A0A5N5QR99_9AGAM|nr:Primary-amine oxidase [Ceratobasidium theobromae]